MIMGRLWRVLDRDLCMFIVELMVLVHILSRELRVSHFLVMKVSRLQTCRSHGIKHMNLHQNILASFLSLCTIIWCCTALVISDGQHQQI